MSQNQQWILLAGRLQLHAGVKESNRAPLCLALLTPTEVTVLVMCVLVYRKLSGEISSASVDNAKPMLVGGSGGSCLPLKSVTWHCKMVRENHGSVGVNISFCRMQNIRSEYIFK